MENLYRGECIINEDDYIGNEDDVKVDFKASPIRLITQFFECINLVLKRFFLKKIPCYGTVYILL